MPPPETGKQRAARIPLDYFKRPNFLERWKGWLAAAGLVVPLLWLAGGLLRGNQGQLRYSRGPVAVVHAAWEDNCNACHVPFTPISGPTWTESFVGHANASDQRCQTCHTGPPHHAEQTPELACAACHRDHRGRDASLVRLPDNDCTQCHGNLAGHVKPGTGPLNTENAVSRFEVGRHPQFQILRQNARDPGRLKFNHKLHLALGMATPEAGNPAFTLARIPKPDQERYRPFVQPATGLVQLTCAACHRLESGDFGIPGEQLRDLPAALLPARTAGAYMLPITYENQCRACHPLTVKPEGSGPQTAPLTVPHRLQPKEVHAFLERAFLGEYLDAAKPLPSLGQFLAERPLPGKRPGPQAETVRKLLADQVERTEKLLASKNTCGECHSFEPPGGPFATQTIEAPAVPDVWFRHAVFNHAAHRALQCQQCHAQAESSPTAADVLLPGIDTCVQCHAPQTRAGGTIHGGARWDCTECHLYHHREREEFSRQGIGAAARGVLEAHKLTIAEFLSGRQGE